MREIFEAFAEHGLDPGSIELDGKIHRFKVASDDHKKSGWYIGWQNHARNGGEVFYVVKFGNYRENLRTTFKSDVKYSRDDRKYIKTQMDAAKKKEAEHKKQVYEETAAEVAQLWAKALDIGESGYIKRKKIDGHQLGIKFNGRGDFYVPMQDENGKLWSLQRIYWDGERWAKRFYPGGRVSECFHTIGSIEPSGSVFVAEGFATAASIRIATGGTVIVAFTANNLKSTVRQLRKKYPELGIVVCGDDDRFKDPNKNPGREAAKEAADQCLGRAIFPAFKSIESKPTDFNDLHVLEGLNAVKEQLAVEPPPKMAVYALGYDGSEYFFTSTQNRQIVGLQRLAESQLLGLMTYDYWEAIFPGQGKSRVDWSLAESTLKDQARKMGVFKMRNVRGAGVWIDDDRIVVNMGDHLIVNGVRIDLGEIKSRYFYTLAVSLPALHTSPLSVAECLVLKGVCEKFKWLKPESGILLAGALVCARVCGALPVRPHSWITGSAQTGKTTLLERLIRPILGESVLYVQGNTTEAGVRQSLRANALPVIFDEFETTGAQSAEKIAQVIDLMRAAWSDSGALIIKGGASGTASPFQTRFCAIVSSIRTRLINDADKGRFAVLELVPHGGDQKHWKILCELLAKIDDEYSERLFARTIKMLPTLLANFKVLKVALSKRADVRFGDQYGMLLAGYTILLTDEPLDASDAETLAEMIELAEEKENAKVADHDDALNHLLTTKIIYNIEIASAEGESRSQREEKLIGQLIHAAIQKRKDAFSPAENETDPLIQLGIKVGAKPKGSGAYDYVAIAGSHAELQKQVWRGTNWTQSWSRTLGRLPGAKRNEQVWMHGKNTKCVLLPFDLFKS